MLGGIVGDIVGSPYEYDHRNIKTTDFPLFSKASYVTDDSIMILAVAQALMDAMPSRGAKATDNAILDAVTKRMREFGLKYPGAGYGGGFAHWLSSKDPKPYNSYGNGSAMRVSPAAWAFDTLADVEHCAALTAQVTHNHPEGVKGAVATAGAIFLARTGSSKGEIWGYSKGRHGYNMNRTLADIRPTYHHVESCQETVPEAILAFYEANGFEDCLRKAVSLGGDSDTLTAISASIAEGMWGIPKEITKQARVKMDAFQIDVLDRFDAWRGVNPD